MKAGPATKRQRKQGGSLLPCGHPNKPRHLIGGKCGTCDMALSLLEETKSMPPKGRKAARHLAKLMLDGFLLYDTRGKSLLEWEAKLRP